MQLVTANVEGKFPGTNLYRDDTGENHYLILASRIRGVPTTIIRAHVEYYPVTEWDTSELEDPEADRRRIGVDAIERVTAVDADGDPLNGLTPLHTLPPGTTHDEAIAFLTNAEEPTE
jgi:hypothetical protein